MVGRWDLSKKVGVPLEKVKTKGGSRDLWEEEGKWKKEGSHGRNLKI